MATITSESEVVIIPFSTQINGVDGLRIFAASTDPPSAGVHDFETIQNLVADGHVVPPAVPRDSGHSG